MRTYQQKLEANLWKIYIFKALLKRVYWPVMVIYTLFFAELTPQQFGLTVSIGAIAGLLLEVPSGYISDRFGHKATLVLSYSIYALSPLFYIFMPNFLGITLGTILFVMSLALSSGTFQAFYHETLIELGRPDDYTRVMTRAQAVSLFFNAVLLATVSFLYPINPRLPFIVGFFLLSLNAIISTTLTVPQKTKQSVAELESVSFINLMKSLKNTKRYGVFFVVGLMGGVYAHAGKFRELYFQFIGIPVEYFGLILSLSSLLAGLAGLYAHRLQGLKDRTFYLLDFAILFLTFMSVSITKNPIIGAALFVLYIVYLRARREIITGHLLRDSPTRQLKATYLSLASFLELLHSIWVPVVLGLVVGRFGPVLGHRYFALIILIPFTFFYLLYFIQQNRSNDV